jgi:hypothetical protein
VNETVRLVRTGGLIVFVEISFPWPLIGVPEDKQRSIAPGFTKLSDYFSMYIADLRLRLGPDTAEQGNRYARFGPPSGQSEHRGVPEGYWLLRRRRADRNILAVVGLANR